MTVMGYLRYKYGIDRPTTCLYWEAQTFGIGYPLPPGWAKKHGPKEVPEDHWVILRARLEKMIKKNKNVESAQRGIEIIDAFKLCGESW